MCCHCRWLNSNCAFFFLFIMAETLLSMALAIFMYSMKWITHLSFISISIRYYWMQDGAPAHCTTQAKFFLVEKFRGRVISRGTEIGWPVHSPDLKPAGVLFLVICPEASVRSKVIYHCQNDRCCQAVCVWKQRRCAEGCRLRCIGEG